MVLLKPHGSADDSEKAIVGNTILVAQPTPQLIANELPPTEAQQASYFNVVYAASASEHGAGKLNKKQALVIDREQYMTCARLRRERCPLFAEIPVNEGAATERLPERDVPYGIDRGAVEMESLKHFAPNLSGPATRSTPFAGDDDEDSAAPESEDEDAAEDDHAEGLSSEPGCSRAPDALIAEENANAEFLIGLDGSPQDDAFGKLMSVQAKWQSAQEIGKKLAAVCERREHASAAEHDQDAAMDAAVVQAALTQEHKSVCVDLRTMARSMGDRFHDEIERTITAAHRKSSPATLRIRTGAPLNTFDPSAWVAGFPKFFYGDCAPNLDRPAKIPWRALFKYLMNREELEYHLPSDKERYKANPDSRWNKPEFAAVFVDALRKLEVLQSTKGFYEKHGDKFKEDIRTIASLTDKDLERFQATLQQRGLQHSSMTALVAAAGQEGIVSVQKTLQHMLMCTASAPMTEGNKMTIRHMGQAMNARFGPFSAFYTCNFADTYHPLTVALAQGAFEPLGRRPLDILQDSPLMPTSQEMHRIVASRPMVQANLFLLLDAVTHQNLLCTRSAFLGKRKYDPCHKWSQEPLVEDDFASSGDCGLAAFVRALIKALEAQGRGFAHGHEKTHSEPRTKAIDLICQFLGEDDAGAAEHADAREEKLAEWMDDHRDACLRDASTKQYGSAIESGRQFGIVSLKEIFTAEERKRCRLDGGEEEDGTRRDDVEVVPLPEPAHVLREKDMAIAEGRSVRHSYTGMPLTGAPGARFPLYLRGHLFDRYPDLDESGHATATLDAGAAEHSACNTGWVDNSEIYVLNADGEVEGFRKEDGSIATMEELEQEARRYSQNWAVDSRFCHAFNHSHQCKPTCFKNAEQKKPSDANAPDTSAQRGSCRFRFWRLVKILQRWWRRAGKALVPEPEVAAADDADNEYGRCKVCRQNCFRGSSSDVSQVCLRCNVDLQHQVRTFPANEQIDESEALRGKEGAAEHDSERPSHGSSIKALPGLLRLLANRIGKGKQIAAKLLGTFAVAMRSSHVADFYATKYLAKPQQWLTSVLGPLISGFRRHEQNKTEADQQLQTKQQALKNLRVAIFAANRAVWISCCEACLYIQTRSSAVQSHADVTLHARKGLFMMHECKRILNKDVAGDGLWQADLADLQMISRCRFIHSCF